MYNIKPIHITQTLLTNLNPSYKPFIYTITCLVFILDFCITITDGDI
jgi:hypothetical protein